jgi:DNA-binding NarL/FixJ family response regulator
MSTSPDHAVSVLVADDEEALRTLTRRRLERTGWYRVVAEAATTAEAIDLTEHHQPDVVLLDLLLGPDHGTDIIGDLLRVAPLTLIAVLTVLSAEDQEEAAKLEGAFVFYEKALLADLPVHLREDLQTFRRALDGEDVVAPSAVARRP